MKKLIAVLIFGIILVGCTTSTIDKDNGDKTPQENQTETKEESQIKEETESPDEVLLIETEAIEKKDASICNKIKDENEKISCKFNVITPKAMQESDPSFCDEIGDESFVEMCKQSLSEE